MRAKAPLSVAMIWIMCACAVAQSRSTNTGVVSGVVEDSQGARVPMATIELHDGSDRVLKAVANEAGEFRIEVPPGVYGLNIGGVRGFVPFTRPKFHVSSGMKLKFPVQLEVAFTCEPGELGIEGQGITQYEEPEPTCGSVERTLAMDERSSREFVVRYSGRSGTGATREYAGAALFCDVYSVKADKVVYESGNKRASAEGRVVVEDGHTTRRVKSAVIQWPECRPEIVE